MSSVVLFWVVFLPIIAGALCFIIPDRAKRLREGFTSIITLATLVIAVLIFLSPEMRFQTSMLGFAPVRFLDFYSYQFSSFLVMFASLFGFLISLYSIKYMEGRGRLREYYPYILLTVGAANGALLSDNFLPFLGFWGIILVTLFLFTTIGSRDASPERAFDAASKNMMILGSADLALIMGVGFLWYLSGSLTLSEVSIPLHGAMATSAFILIMIGAIAKAGAMPVHSWIPHMAEASPTSVMAFLPGSLDKLLGIYLLARMVLDFFELNFSMSLLLMIIGAVTIVAAVMMAMIQHDVRKLLSFHAVSQVGYMVLGIGTGTAIGIAGGIFHMLNNAVFKNCLFLTAGSVERRAGTTDLAKLGGLGKMMPFTMVAFFIAALSISGVPPLNGFASKWMIYQGVIEAGASYSWIFLVAAMFGSALTLASFIKIGHAIFLGDKPREIGEVKEVEHSMRFPMGVLAALCVVFGIFAQLPLVYFVGPVVGVSFPAFPAAITWTGIWSPTLGTILLLVALAIGGLIYLAGHIKTARTAPLYIGGETTGKGTTDSLSYAPARLTGLRDTRVLGTEFYDTIRNMGGLKGAYNKGEVGSFDIYNSGKPATPIAKALSILHNGHLSNYVSWCLWGLVILFIVLASIG
jgi:NADH:ubiquinone oxidoreductase subunit 5 (chain L)/Multisubunit Na+/H+ antiporter, MnhA subunit